STISVAGATDAPLELRGSLDCWACSVLVRAQNLIIALVNSTLVTLVMVVFGFLCHSTVRLTSRKKVCVYLLDDGGCVALLVVGFILVTPLLVLALATYCRLARHLQLGLCFIPYSRAVFKNLPASHQRGGGCCGQHGASEGEGKGSVWV
uniref:Transmembrane protein 88 a n=1 Tax=Oncorhynchus tshawytscha TaxID=74940 RepID=A0A8C8CFP7_ONCTS